MNPKIYTVLLLLLGLALPVLSDKCPDQDRQPTTCNFKINSYSCQVTARLSCSGVTISELKDVLRLMDKSSRLEVHLENMKLGDLPSRIFYGLKVVGLNISHCELDGLAPPGEYALEGLEETLEGLHITASFTEEKRPTTLYSLAHLRRLQHLHLLYNAITEVHNHWFSSPPPALYDLVFIQNGINKLGDRAFEKLVNLQYLELIGNRFGPIKRSMLPTPANKLVFLKLRDNDFTSLPDDLFTDMRALRIIDIEKNRIARLQEQAFKPIWPQLYGFEAIGNSLECDSTMEWMFHVRTEAEVRGFCEGPVGRKGTSLEDFIKKRGQ